MKSLFVTYADRGKYRNLKTEDIAGVIDYFENKKAIFGVISRIGTDKKKDFYQYSALPLFLHFLIAGFGKFFKDFPSRKIEEYFFDFFASKFILKDKIVFFHPPKFPKTININKTNNNLCIGIAVNSHPLHTESLMKKELEKNNIKIIPKNTIEADYAFNMDYLIALSPFSKKTYVENGYPENKIFVANLDINTERFVPLKKNENYFTVVFPASNIGILKGLQYVLDAWQEFDIPNKKLIILGKKNLWPIEMKEKYEKIIKKDISIKELGIVNNPEFILGSSDVTILPSFTEGFSRSVAESMSCGVPVITTKNATDTENFFQDRKHGIIVREGESDDILKALNYLYSNKEECIDMGVASREAVLKKECFNEKVFCIYENILKIENIK
ncbi:glycosyltransferase [Candidatus Nomurabacteria bacterium]|nr:glycosyltransferase [Candidatus Nomurabacteria bacterium]